MIEQKILIYLDNSYSEKKIIINISPKLQYKDGKKFHNQKMVDF